jgi:hypothetical protein
MTRPGEQDEGLGSHLRGLNTMKLRGRQLVGMCANGHACLAACRAAESTNQVSAM